ncbi:hypothetical protein NDU88_001498 [Pleurodeles waltl]|uniref:Uncharacterized protein n=1 Tax=Pleurodeles waltl TaxID=8319 RepID=A0AAV7LYU0_PLEWA|nr:hypothetical protein NDU88_001498 [Pleurodeles waltl]
MAALDVKAAEVAAVKAFWRKTARTRVNEEWAEEGILGVMPGAAPVLGVGKTGKRWAILSLTGFTEG